MQTIRLFLAIEFNQIIKQDIASLIENYQRDYYKLPIKWSKTENLHLTLKFLGETPLDKIEEIDKIVSITAEKNNKFELKFTQTGVFPSSNSPKVLWVGIMKNNYLVNLADQLNLNFAKLIGHKENKKFIPHLTLGRVKQKLNPSQINLLKKDFLKINNFNIPTQKVRDIVLYKSNLKPSGPVYTELARYKLNS